MTKVRLTTEALSELQEARDWYEGQAPNLGEELISEFKRSAELIATFPKACTELERGYRRRVLSRFPYSVVYQESDAEVLVVAVWHAARDPAILAARLT